VQAAQQQGFSNMLGQGLGAAAMYYGGQQ